MPLARHVTVIPGGPEHLGQRHALVVELPAQVRHADLVRVQARQERGPRRAATRRVVELREPEPVPGQSVKMGRPDLAAVTSQVAEAQVIGEDQEDIGPALRAGRHLKEPEHEHERQRQADAREDDADIEPGPKYSSHRAAPPALSCSRSVTAGVDDLAARPGGDAPPDLLGDGALDELHRAVEHADVHAAGMVRAGARSSCARFLASIALEQAGLLVRRHDVRVSAALAGPVVQPELALAVPRLIDRDR